MADVLVPLAKGFEEIEAVTIIDVLRRGGVDVTVASIGDHAHVEGANGIVLVSDSDMKNVDSDVFDMVVLPGGWGGTHALADDEHVQKILKEMDAKGKLIGAICAAPFALNKAGVLKPNFTCYPSVEEQIDLDGYQGDKAKVVEEGNVITSRGPGTAMCFALEIVKKLEGEEAYNQVKSGLLADFC
ncbi:DJ-1 family glyoxalase III [Sulfurimonas sp.]|uniref:DJ-1 family glyoxalase III n=1 Tax=Sulfurimonas sp. TaxID=2022749 RepID=UPI003563514C